jgi:3-isopropylmalate/(R)-2-methylmalate dehydratase large subunit
MKMKTLVQKIIEKKGRSQENFAVLNVDAVMSHDTTTPLAIEAFEKFHEPNFFDKDKIKIFFDHIYPASHLSASELHKRMTDFSKLHGLKITRGEGICHTLMIERHVTPGMVVAGGDSHTPVYGVTGALAFGIGSTDLAACWKSGKIWIKVPESILINIEGACPAGTYAKDIALRYVKELSCKGGLDKALEFRGGTLKKIDVFERMPIGIMATETSASTQIFWDEEKGLEGDGGADYSDTFDLDVSDLEPQVACPHEVDNVKNIREVEGIGIDQVFLGSCTNGTYRDLEIASRILDGKKIDEETRFIVIPASKSIYRKAVEKGIAEILLESGAMVLYPGCGPCLGRQQGVLAAGEKCLSTANRNYRGRMGSPEAEIYLSSPATAAASALKGEITDPRRYING